MSVKLKRKKTYEDSDEPFSTNISNGNPSALIIPVLIHYLFLLLAVVVGQLIGMISLSYQAFPIYIFTCYISIQLLRFSSHVTKSTYIQQLSILSTILPYISLFYMTQQRHQEFAVAWLFSISFCLISHLVGCREETLNVNISIYTGTFVLLYAILTGTLSTVMNNTIWVQYTTSPSSTTSNSATYTVEPVIEVVVAFGLALLAYSLSSLQFHFARWGEISDARKDLISRVKHKNKYLRQELDKELLRKKQNSTPETSFISPIARVIKMVRDLQVNCEDLTDEAMGDLDYVIHLLLSNHLFKPQFMNSNMETEVNQWLKQITESEREEEGGKAVYAPVGILSNERGSTVFDSSSRLGGNSSVLGPEGGNRKKDGGKIYPETTIHKNIQEMYQHLNTWDFPLFEFAERTEKRPLYCMGQEFFDLYKFEELLLIPREKFTRFLARVESTYRSHNLYHNSTHAADVMHAMNFFISVLKLGELLTIEEIFACLVAAALHDVDHAGFNNSFMIASLSPIALRYNDVSVLENYHCAKGFELMAEPGCEILETLKPDQFKTVRGGIISMILSTDMVNHFEYITKFKNKLNGDGVDVKDHKSRALLMDIAIKCADISNVCKTSKLSLKWTNLIMAEFFHQGDEELKLGLPVSPLMDRHNTSISKCQLGFIDFIVFPLYEQWCKYLDEEGKFPAMDNLLQNREFWKTINEQAAMPVMVRVEK